MYFVKEKLITTVSGVLEVKAVDALPFGSIKHVTKKRRTSGRLTTSSHASISVVIQVLASILSIVTKLALR